ncbi:MAG: PKD domain-containing protein [Candidatus Falkowbacteria bacterium]
MTLSPPLCLNGFTAQNPDEIIRLNAREAVFIFREKGGDDYCGSLKIEITPTPALPKLGEGASDSEREGEMTRTTNQKSQSNPKKKEKKMKTTKIFSALVLALIFCLAFSGLAGATADPPATGYTVTKIGNFPDDCDVSVGSINDTGQIVGSYYSKNNPEIRGGFIWDSTTNATTYLGDIYPEGINNSGRVIGYSYISGDQHGFIWDNGVITDLGLFIPVAINDNNQIAGYVYIDDYTAYLWENGSLTVLTGGYYDPWDINNFGHIVGETGDGTGFLWENGTITIIQGEAHGINDNKQVVGALDDGSIEFAFLWVNNTLQDLGLGNESFAYAINNASQIVGSFVVGGENRIFLWLNGEVTNLNEFFSFSDPWVSVGCLNNKGQIIVMNYDAVQDSYSAYLLTPINQPPTATTCGDQTATPGVVTTLDASASSDPEENYPLTYTWTLVSAPAGSSVSLDDPTAVSPSFTPDLPGAYVFELVVADSLGSASAPVTVTVTSVNNPPTANAGPDQAVTQAGTVIALDGTQSSDPEDNDLTYTWTVVSVPGGSSAVLSDEHAAQPQFTADLYGSYVFELVVNDGYADSEPDTVTVTFENAAPVADVGGNQSVVIGETVYLDGSGSHDANGDSLTYSWSLVSVPEGSNAAISDSTAVNPVFTADLAGEYVVSLVVNDGLLSSAPAIVTIVAIANDYTATDYLQFALAAINGLADDDFRKDEQRDKLTKKINNALKKIDKGKIDQALNILENRAIARVDGCALRGEPDNVADDDKKDWIDNCAAQALVYPLILAAIEELRE